MDVSQLFVVRVWRVQSNAGERMFRASVRRVDSEDTRLFSVATDLARYLDEQAAASDLGITITGSKP